MTYFRTTFLIGIACILVFLAGCNDRKKAELAFRKSKYHTLSLDDRRKPENAVLALKTYPGLEVTLFASEPMVENPTNLDVDARGRVWICEAYNYGLTENQEKEQGGRISILEDTDGDGVADKKKVFYEGEDVKIALGISVLGNKVYVTQSPNLLVFTDEDGDDVPDKKEVFFTGMGQPGDHSAHSVIPGPDGKLYFTYGNAGKEVLHPDSSRVVDIFGHSVKSDGHPYYGGMIFRCNPDGSEFEVLGNNFRNNYEATVDSYGNIWQSDNDDDGYKSCRINFILEYGNYGYLDEMTGAHWSTPRTGESPEIPRRHWHQNDPGSVPNLLITGAGSPAGMCFYEGDLLPEIFRNQMIHTDAGPNVVRAYPVAKKGAGYEAGIEKILWSDDDRWFRPVDVAVAPDGSLMIADWYDPIVGGGAVGDTVALARIYRVAPEGDKYHVKYKEVTNVTRAIDALKSPNVSLRYQGREFLVQQGAKAEKALKDLWEDENPVYRARALWLLTKIENKGNEYLMEAVGDKNENIRVTAVRIAAELNLLFPDLAKEIIKDNSPRVLRELAIELHRYTGPEKFKLWAQLADRYRGEDRWYLESLNISAKDDWDSCFAAWIRNEPPEITDKKARDIIWLSRARQSVPLKLKVIEDAQSDSSEILRFFRSFDFMPDKSIDRQLLALLDLDHPQRDLINSLVIQHIDPSGIEMSAQLRKAIDHVLVQLKGTQEFVSIVDRYNLKDYNGDLMKIVLESDSGDLAVNSLKVLTGNPQLNGVSLVRKMISGDRNDSKSIVKALGFVGTETAMNILRDVVTNSRLSSEVRREGIRALGDSWWGEDILLDIVRKNRIGKALKPVAASVLFSVYRASIREEAARYLEPSGTAGGLSVPPIRDLLSYNGDAEQGKLVFGRLCTACHRIGNEGVRFGPELSQIGGKLSKEGIYTAVIYPDQGISNGYEGYVVRLKNGGVVSGLQMSRTEQNITIRQIGGIDNTIRMSDVASIEMMENSMMTKLVSSMSRKELIDLVEYLSSQK